MKKKQEIVPVRLQEERKSVYSQKTTLQKLVARLKWKGTELFIYEGIQPHILKVLLEETGIHEAR